MAPRTRPRLAATAVATALAATLALGVPPASAFAPDATATAEDPAATAAEFDVRDALAPVAPTDVRLAAVDAILAAAGPDAAATWDDRFGTPRTLRNPGGWLTGPADGDAADLARAFLDDHRDAFGLTPAAVSALTVTRDHELPGTGTRVVVFAQTFAGGVQASRGGHLTVAVTEDGRVLSYAGDPVPTGVLTGGFELSTTRAVEAAGGAGATLVGALAGYDVARTGETSSYVRQVAFPVGGEAVPAFRVLLIEALDEAYDVIVDARDGAILYRESLVDHGSEGTVYANHPGAEHGGAPEIASFGPTAESPGGYVDPSGLAGLPGPTTLGNNANTYANYSNFLVPADQGPRPISATSQFNYAYADNWGRTQGAIVPPSYALDLDPAATNLFWHHNRIHDEFAGYGFTESAGNFQLVNASGEGQGGDALLGLVHAGALSGGAPTYTGRDNAYMLTLPDGIPAWSGMFLWEPINDAFEGKYADGNFDASIIEHEYAHGLTNRYVGPEDNSLGGHQSGSMGEGWSDWYALNYLYREGLAESPVVGEHVTGNAERGIRNWSYDDNPLTFGDVGYDLGGAEVHSDGEIWTATLWDVRKALVGAYGEAAGGEMAARIITDAMPLSPADPSFVDMRDAIRSALDDRYHAREDYRSIVDLVFTAFAERGLGAGAASDGAGDTDPTPSFAHIDPARNGTASGTVVNAATGRPIAGAKIIVGVFEARVSPVTSTSDGGTFALPAVSGTHPLTIAAPGFGAQTFQVTVSAGKTANAKYSLAPNLAAAANGATVVSATADGTAKLIDDTEGTSWSAAPGTGNAVIELAASAKITAVQVSAFAGSRFEGLRGFTLQTSTDGVNWDSVLVEADAFGYAAPRPTAPDLHYRQFTLDTPVTAKYLRFWTDSAQGETKTEVQVAELQVYSGTVKGVEPLPPSPPDEPVTDEGTIAAANPGTGTTDDAAGITANAFKAACAVPPAPAQGADAWVTALPESFGDGVHTVTVTGESAAGTHDLDLYFYDASCELVGSAASSAADESATLPADTRYVLSQLWLGAAVTVHVLAEDTE